MYNKEQFIKSISKYAKDIHLKKAPNPQFDTDAYIDLKKGKVKDFIDHIAIYYGKLDYDLYKRDTSYSVHIELTFQMI